MTERCAAPGRACRAEPGANSLCLGAGDTESNTSSARDVQALAACIVGGIGQLITHLNAAREAASQGNLWDIIGRLRNARESWLSVTKDAKLLAEITDADESDWPDWPDFSLPEAEIWLNVEPEFGLRGKSRRFLVGPSGLAAALAFFELLEAQR
jgi:hypothetical protein